MEEPLNMFFSLLVVASWEYQTIRQIAFTFGEPPEEMDKSRGNCTLPALRRPSGSIDATSWRRFPLPSEGGRELLLASQSDDVGDERKASLRFPTAVLGVWTTWVSEYLELEPSDADQDGNREASIPGLLLEDDEKLLFWAWNHAKSATTRDFRYFKSSIQHMVAISLNQQMSTACVTLFDVFENIYDENRLSTTVHIVRSENWRNCFHTIIHTILFAIDVRLAAFVNVHAKRAIPDFTEEGRQKFYRYCFLRSLSQ